VPDDAAPLAKPYDAKTVEAAAQALWEKERCHAFDAEAAKRDPGNVFSVDTPPPTVSGSLHIGHVFSYTQAECVVRYQRMRGRNVFYPFGFDGNGLPTERLTEKEHGVLGKAMKRPEFVKLCLETSRKYEKEFEALWRSLGVSADWSLVYSTIDERSMRVSQRGFLDLVKKGEVEMREEPTLWCTLCGTALAQADLEFKDKPSVFTTLRFELSGGGDVQVATTRPELLPACVSVFVHPSHPRASDLVGRAVMVPLQEGRTVTIRADERVDPEKGTGVVMCCTFGDKTDVEWFRRHRLDLRKAIGPDGLMTADAGPEAGLHVTKARKAILARLEAAGHVLDTKEIVHPVATHERCGTEIQFVTARQLFVRLLDKKADLISQGERVRWFPEHMGKRYRNWVENLEWDWCVSRQRFFGVPFPGWVCDECGTPFFAREEELPLDPTVVPANRPCPKGHEGKASPITDVMDTWATSSETPQINARWGEPPGPPRSPLPMSLRPQAHDIIRTWAFYTIAKSWIHHRALPWGDVMVSGHVQAPGKEKISKSKGNAPTDPNVLVEKHGADAVRYWALSAKLGNDYVFSEEDLAAGRRLCVKLWNAARLVLGHLAGYDPAGERAPARAVDRGIRERLDETAAEATRLLDGYEFGLAKQRVCDFFWGDLCDHWLEMVKDRLYDASPEAATTRRSAQATAHDVLWGTIRLLAPFVPHVAEAVHQERFRATEGIASVTRAPWPEGAPAPAEGSALPAWRVAVEALSGVRKWRSENKVSPAKPIPKARVRLPAAAAALWLEVEADVRSAGRVEAFEVAAAGDGEAVAVEVLTPPAA
jgi:valyl-tRNA synthetase